MPSLDKSEFSDIEVGIDRMLRRGSAVLDPYSKALLFQIVAFGPISVPEIIRNLSMGVHSNGIYKDGEKFDWEKAWDFIVPLDDKRPVDMSVKKRIITILSARLRQKNLCVSENKGGLNLLKLPEDRRDIVFGR